MFRLASLGMFDVNNQLGEENFAGLQTFITAIKGEWDDFNYRQSINVLVRYSLVQRVYGQWPGTTMHSLVQWRAIHRDPDQQWQCWYTKFVLAACCQIMEEDHIPEFRRHLVLHLPDITKMDVECISTVEMGNIFI